MDLWLSSQAYIRITSFLSFIPDLWQIGAEFKLWVMDSDMPYVLEKGVRNTAAINEVYKVESLQTDIESGNGYVNTFLRVLGFDVDAFGDEAGVQWAGVSYHKNNFAKEQASIVEALFESLSVEQENENYHFAYDTMQRTYHYQHHGKLKPIFQYLTKFCG